MIVPSMEPLPKHESARENKGQVKDGNRSKKTHTVHYTARVLGRMRVQTETHITKCGYLVECVCIPVWTCILPSTNTVQCVCPDGDPHCTVWVLGRMHVQMGMHIAQSARFKSGSVLYVFCLPVRQRDWT